jgi:hypothetical protein
MRRTVPTAGPADPVTEIVARLWQTKLRSINLLETWLPHSSDFGIRAGLQAHLAEERRHQRLIGAEISRRGDRQAAMVALTSLDKPFGLVREQTDELARVRLFHQGIKAPTVLYGQRCIPLVDPSLAHVLEQVTRDEERHIRWAEIRLRQEFKTKSVRNLDPVLIEVESAMEIFWSKPWQRLTQANFRLGKTG